MKRDIVFEPAYDKRNADAKKNYGIHGVNMCWYLKGELGTVQFLVYTNWHLPHVQDEIDAKAEPEYARFKHYNHKPQPADVGYHSPKPMYDDDTPVLESCDALDGRPCYYGGSGLHAQHVFGVLLKEGDKAVWKHLEDYYEEIFGELK